MVRRYDWSSVAGQIVQVYETVTGHTETLSTKAAQWGDDWTAGFTNDGFVAIRDRSAVGLQERRNLESLVADENRDRAAVYREIAVANNHPEWESDIQKTFAREWVQKARSGWYYQNASGEWVAK